MPWYQIGICTRGAVESFGLFSVQMQVKCWAEFATSQENENGEWGFRTRRCVKPELTTSLQQSKLRAKKPTFMGGREESLERISKGEEARESSKEEGMRRWLYGVSTVFFWVPATQPSKPQSRQSRQYVRGAIRRRVESCLRSQVS